MAIIFAFPPKKETIATVSRAGIVKPDGTTITIDSDGSIHSPGNTKQQDITTIETSNTASKAYNIHDVFYLNNNLYEVDVAISQGDTITPGTNCHIVNVIDAVHDYTAANYTSQINISSIENTSTASKAYAVGEYFIYNNQLYKTTNAIAQGGTIITTGVNANVESVTITDEISDVVDALDEKVDVVSGKGLSTNDYSNADKTIVDGVTTALAGKVDVVQGKGLSTNDYDAASKTKLDGLADIKNVGTGLTLDSSTGTLTASGIPAGGTAGQMLIKDSSVDGDASWQSLDATPTQNSTKPATSGGIFTALSNKSTITLTTTDPGEGSPLATNTIVLVVEE